MGPAVGLVALPSSASMSRHWAAGSSAGGAVPSSLQHQSLGELSEEAAQPENVGQQLEIHPGQIARITMGDTLLDQVILSLKGWCLCSMAIRRLLYASPHTSG